MTAHLTSGQKCASKTSQAAEGKRSERKKRKLRLSALSKEEAKGHLWVQDTKLMQSLHHFLVINVAGVVPIVPPAHQSH